MARVALVAGASSGLGLSVARRLAADGIRTYAGARSFAKGRPAPEGCVPIPLDVTDGSSVAEAVGTLLAREGRIDALVNCAAFLTLGACEEISLEELSAVLQTNFLGMARVTRAVLPAMRAQGGGRIVHFSSLNGLFAIPFQGAYTASKHAVEGWSEALSLEVRRFGIGVTLVCPGDCRSGADAYRTHAAAAADPASPYYACYKAAQEKIHHDEANGLDPEKVAKAVSRALSKRRAPARIVVAKADQRLAMWLHDLLPGRLFHRIIAGYYKPPKEAKR